MDGVCDGLWHMVYCDECRYLQAVPEALCFDWPAWLRRQPPKRGTLHAFFPRAEGPATPKRPKQGP